MSEDKTLAKILHFDGHYNHWSELTEEGKWPHHYNPSLHFDGKFSQSKESMECGGDWFLRTRGRNNAD